MAGPTPEIRTFGIRHHGPGSARRLQEALESWQPDVLLLECPADAQPALSFAGDPGLHPPVALLLVDAQLKGRAAHLPFAAFSPEWIALRWAARRSIPVTAIDLPWGISSQLPPTTSAAFREDPFTTVAQTMGYTDTERWWEYYFEQVQSSTDLFPFIAELMTTFRSTQTAVADSENDLREAWMREAIRKASGSGAARIAVVCGAYHVPALDIGDTTRQSDQALLKGYRRKAVTATWVPWTYQHLATRSGYGAGISNPAWYETLFQHPQQAVAHWLAHLARILRQQGHPIPPASVPAAVELAESLATLRGMHHPGISELEEAALACWLAGDPQWLPRIRKAASIGDKMGKVPPSIPLTPLQQDVQKRIRSARLRRARETPGKTRLELDLRKPTNLLASILLHQLTLLEIPWGNLRQKGDRSSGSFRERWTLQWPKTGDYLLLERGAWGLTLSEATTNYTLWRADQVEEVLPVAQLLQTSLAARMEDLAGDLARRLQDRIALSQDVWDLAETLTPLVQLVRYEQPDQPFAWRPDRVIAELIPRVLIGLPRLFPQLAEQRQRKLGGFLRQFLHHLVLLQKEEAVAQYWAILQAASQQTQLPPIVRGSLTRHLFEAGHLNASDLRLALQAVFQDRLTPQTGADWLDGFLPGNDQVLLREHDLWRSLDSWLARLDETAFLEILPVLRRSFSSFSPALRQQIASLIHHLDQPGSATREAGLPAGAVALSHAQQEILLPAWRELWQAPP